MDVEKLRSAVTVVFYIALGFCLLYWIARTLVLEYHNHKNSNAPVLTEPAIAYCKHPETLLVNQGRSSGDVHFIPFHTESGDILRLYMTARDFYSIPEGCKGNLTWQGERFWKFEKEE